jgi:hypothetical protein
VTTPPREWLDHLRREVAAISEGFCPECSDRLLPVRDAVGTMGVCPVHGVWRAYSERERQEDRHDTWTACTVLDAFSGLWGR